MDIENTTVEVENNNLITENTSQYAIIDLSGDIPVITKKSTFILAVDPGTSTGYAIFRISGTKAEIIEYGFLDVCLDSKYQGDHCINLMNQLTDLIMNNPITTILVEDYFFSKSFSNGSNVNVAFRTAIHILARQRNIPYCIINISNWKKHITGSTKPSKKQVELWGAKNAKKYYVQQALWEKYQIKFSNHCMSTKKKPKPIAFRMDIIDAVAQGIFYCETILHIKRNDIICLVNPPTDIPSKKIGTFQYT